MSASHQATHHQILERETHSVDETIELAKGFSKHLEAGDIILLSGEIGAGKTYFAKGLATGLGVSGASEVNSPTYDLVHVFQGRMPLFHVDLYRMEQMSDDDLEWITEYLDAGGVCMIEWGERLVGDLARPYYHIKISYGRDENSRMIKILKSE